jgi:hypothetical protein
MVLEDYLEIARRRRDKAIPLFKVQMHMLEDLVLTQQLIKLVKQRQADERGQAEIDAEAEGAATSELTVYERQLFFNRAQQRAIRDIADGIAWRLFDYDRAVLYMIADRPAAHHVELEGLPSELVQFGQVYEARDGIAVLNDLTHFLKLGDVTVRKDSGHFELIEVKKGRRTSGRITRQKAAMEHVVQLVATGEAETEQGTLRVRQIPVTPESYTKNLGEAVRAAEREGAASLRIADHLVLQVLDLTGSRPFEDLAPILERGDQMVESWTAAGDFVLSHEGLERYEHVRNYAPCSIFPIEPRVRVKLMTGAIIVHFHINVTALLRYLRSRGWDIVRTPEEHAQEGLREGNIRSAGFATVSCGALTVELPGALVRRLTFELLRPRSLVAMLDAMYKQGPAPQQQLLPVLAGERSRWD